MHFLIEEHRRLGVLLGPAGCGKSLLLEIIARRVRAWGRAVAKVGLVGIEPADFLPSVATELQVVVPDGAPGWRVWQSLERRLRENRYQKLETVLLFDDADRATPELLTQVTRIAKSGLIADSWLTVLLAGQAERIGRIGPELLDLSELRIDVPAWDPNETQDFLDQSLQRAGGPAGLFDRAAVQRIHDLAGGSPRWVRQVADLALLAAAGTDRDTIGAATVNAACDQLGVYQFHAR